VTLYDDPNRQCVGLEPIWTQTGDNVPDIPATGATAGIPGSFTPAGCTVPANLAGMTGITATPGTAWTTGQYVQTALTGAPGRVTWSGTGWVGGVAP
jgi:hypothetical protein